LDAFVGRSFFEDPWVVAPASTTLRDGLGPLYNAHACVSCHRPAGRAAPPRPGPGRAVGAASATPAAAAPEPPTGMILRTGRRAGAGFAPDPVYGDTIQRRAVPGLAIAGVAGEADWTLRRVPEALDDGLGAPRRLVQLQPRIERFAYGEPAPGLLASLRLAPSLAGIGRLERI